MQNRYRLDCSLARRCIPLDAESRKLDFGCCLEPEHSSAAVSKAVERYSLLEEQNEGRYCLDTQKLAVSWNEVELCEADNAYSATDVLGK